LLLVILQIHSHRKEVVDLELLVLVEVFMLLLVAVEDLTILGLFKIVVLGELLVAQAVEDMVEVIIQIHNIFLGLAQFNQLVVVEEEQVLIKIVQVATVVPVSFLSHILHKY
jgi:hypothetical protein